MMDIVVVRTRKFIEAIRATFNGDPEDQGDQVFRERIRQDPERYAFSFDVDALPEPFSKPVSIITGRQDSVVGYRDAWDIIENYPRGTFVVFDRMGHMAEEKAELFRTLTLEWLDRVEESAGDWSRYGSNPI
jgi:pimeloyl-ACP methyl ester carboxylesterase